MFVEQAGRASTIPLFDETSAAVFACLCRLTHGDGRRALALLVDVYVTAANESLEPHDLTALTDRARRLYLADDRSPTAVERVIADMHFVEHRPLADVASVVEEPEELVGGIVDSLVAAPTADLRHNEVWFDDATRSEAQRAIAERLPHLEGGLTSIDGSRWRARVIAGLLAAAALVALVVWVRAGNDTGDSGSLPTAAPTTVPASTPTTPASTTAVTTSNGPPTEFTVPSDTATSTPASDPVGYILDPPLPGFVGFGASSRTFDDGFDEAPFPISIWASSDAGSARGRWLALEIDAADPSVGLYTIDVQERLEVAGHPALMSTTPSGVHKLVVPIGDDKQIEVYSYGIDPQEIAALVAATTVGADGVPTFGTDATDALDGLDLVASVKTSQSGLGLSSFLRDGVSVQYQNPDTGSFIGIIAAPQAPNDLLIASLLTGSGVTTSETIAIDDRNVLVTTRVFDSVRTVRFAQWHVGAQTISVFGDLTADDLPLAVRSIRLASVDEWHALAETVPPQIAFDEVPADLPVRSEEIGSVTTTQGSSWTIRLSTEDFEPATDSLQINRLSEPVSGSSFQPSSLSPLPLPIDPNNPLTHYETPDATVLVTAFDAPTSVTTMRVTLYRRTPVDVPVVAVPETALSGAAYVFSELVPYTVELLDANGAVLQTFNS